MSSYAESGRAPGTLTQREPRLLLKVTGEHRAGFRDHVLYAMALGTGLREHELVALDVGDVFDAGGKARRRIVLRVFKGSDRSSGGQDVLVPEGLRAKLNKLRAWKVRGGEWSCPASVDRFDCLVRDDLVLDRRPVLDV